MIDIRDHIRALDERGAMERRLAGRPDIHRYARMLIEAQDAVARGETPLVPAAITRGLPKATDICALLVAPIEVEPTDTDEGLPIPGGVRFPLFVFSPVLQVARLRSPGGVVEGRRIPALPISQKALEDWLLASVGLISPASLPIPMAQPADPALISGRLEDEARRRRAEAGDSRAQLEKDFAGRFKFSVAELSAWLLALRDVDPVAFILLMSREYTLGLKHRPMLAHTERAEHGARVHLKSFAHRQILAPLAVAELQRVFAMTRDLHRYGGKTGTVAVKTTVHHPSTLALSGAARTANRGQHIVDALEAETGAGHTIDESPFHADALRRLLNLRGRRLAELDYHAIYSALTDGRDDWDNSKSAQTRAGALELIATAIAPEVMRRPGLGRGQRLVDRPLDLFCGISAAVLPALAITEISLALGGTKGRQQCATLASAMLATVGVVQRVGSTGEGLHRQAVEALDHYLPPYPKLGSAGRFVPVAWLERHRDHRIFHWLMTNRQPEEDEEERLDDKRWLMGLALRLLKDEFPGVYANRRPKPSDLALCSDLASATTMLTSDPILLALLLRSVEAAGQARKETARRAALESVKGYSNMNPKRERVSIGDSGLSMQTMESRVRAILQRLGIA